jgi:bacillithiol system protein YtxJ
MNRLIPLEAKNLPQSCYVYKHSTTCPVSANALSEVRAGSATLPVYQVNVREQRELSHWVADAFHVGHESPQLILIREGKAVKVWNHWEIRKGEMTE